MAEAVKKDRAQPGNDPDQNKPKQPPSCNNNFRG